jgi:hypothetical protein
VKKPVAKKAAPKAAVKKPVVRKPRKIATPEPVTIETSDSTTEPTIN